MLGQKYRMLAGRNENSLIHHLPLGLDSGLMDYHYRDMLIARLPACQSCYTKKSKCDNARPKCTPCTRNSSVCYTVSVDGSEPISREYIHQLEQSMGETTTQPQRNSPIHMNMNEVGNETDTNGNDSSSIVDPHSSSNEGIGIRFMSVLFTDIQWKEQNLKILQDLCKASTALESSVHPNPLPSSEQGRLMFDNYLNGSHVQNPFLLRQDVQRLYNSVFSADSTQADFSRHDLYRAFMVLAIGSIHMFRNGTCKHHPYGYYSAAIQYLDPNIFSGGMVSIQDLLLIVRFGIYHHIGTSIWELIGICVHMCIENDLHKPPRRSSKHKTTLLDEQIQRRVFWECYMIDRYSSITLDRPPAIADEDIHIELPVDANDEAIKSMDESGSYSNLDAFCHAIAQERTNTSANSEMSVFLFCLRLRKITSSIQKFRRKNERISSCACVFSTESITVSGRIHLELEELLSKLESWRCSAPFFARPRTLYETQQWYDLLLLRERLILIRMAIDIVPKQRNNIPPLHLISSCLESATGVIAHFCALFTERKVTYTRSYFQMLFAAGLSVMYCLSVMKHSPETIKQAISTMDEAKTTLDNIGKVLKDAVPYVSIYSALQKNILCKLNITGEYYTRGFQGFMDSGDYGMSGHMQKQQQQQQPVESTRNYSIGSTNLGTMLENESEIGALLSPWDILGDNTLWNMEAGMGEYVYGDPMVLFSNINEL